MGNNKSRFREEIGDKGGDSQETPESALENMKAPPPEELAKDPNAKSVGVDFSEGESSMSEFGIPMQDSETNERDPMRLVMVVYKKNEGQEATIEMKRNSGGITRKLTIPQGQKMFIRFCDAMQLKTKCGHGNYVDQPASKTKEFVKGCYDLTVTELDKDYTIIAEFIKAFPGAKNSIGEGDN